MTERAGAPVIRAVGAEEVAPVVNAAAIAYRGEIPADRWHDPYMPLDEAAAEIAAGVEFSGLVEDGRVIGVMGVQPVLDVALIRHAYVLPEAQGRGVGGILLAHLEATTPRRLLVGTWAAATWAIRFYERHGFVLVDRGQGADLLRRYWSIPERQIDTSVVLAKPALV